MSDLTNVTGNYIVTAKENWSSNLNGGINNTDTTITVDDNTDYAENSYVILVIDAVDPSTGEATPDKMEVIYGKISSSNTITSCVRGIEGTAQSHSDGAVVYDYSTASHNNIRNKLLQVEHDADGKHTNITADSVVVADGGNIEADHILEATAGHGVNVDGLLIKDSKLATNDSVVTANITDDAVTMPKIYNPYRARAYASTNQTISDNVATTVTFGGESFDTNSNFASNSYTVATTGYYNIRAAVMLTCVSKIAVATMYVYSDSTVIGIVTNAPGTALDSVTSLTYADLVYITAGKVITVKALCNTSDGSTADITGSSGGKETFIAISLQST